MLAAEETLEEQILDCSFARRRVVGRPRLRRRARPGGTRAGSRGAGKPKRTWTFRCWRGRSLVSYCGSASFCLPRAVGSYVSILLHPVPSLLTPLHFPCSSLAVALYFLGSCRSLTRILKRHSQGLAKRKPYEAVSDHERQTANVRLNTARRY